MESGLAVAVLTQCSVPLHLQILGSEHLLGPLEPMEVSLFTSRASQGFSAEDSLYDLLLRALRARKVENLDDLSGDSTSAPRSQRTFSPRQIQKAH